MHVRLNIDFEISPRVKRVLKIGIPLLILLAGSVVFASVPNTFKDGDSLAAQTMNDNFTNLDTRLAKMENRVTPDGGLSINATYVGVSANVTKGDLSGLSFSGSGYAKARSACVAAFGASAHMCTADELVRSAQLGTTFAAGGWYSSGISSSDPTHAAIVDCKAWTDGTGASAGPVYTNASGAGANNCDSNLPILCCN